jgi:hypothetical protein
MRSAFWIAKFIGLKVKIYASSGGQSSTHTPTGMINIKFIGLKLNQMEFRIVTTAKYTMNATGNDAF